LASVPRPSAHPLCGAWSMIGIRSKNGPRVRVRNYSEKGCPSKTRAP
jgi:hypothetical protein